MKKTGKLMAMLLAAVLAFSLAACGAGSSTVDSTAAGSAAVSSAESSAANAETATAVEEATPADSTAEEIASDDTAAPATGPVELPISEEKLTYTMFMTEPFFIGSLIDSMSEDLGLFKAAQENTNIYFDVTAVNGETFDEQFQLMVASGDYYDVMDGMSKYPAGYDAAIEEDICIDLYDLVLEYAPNYYAAISQDADTIAQLVTDEGNMATFGLMYKSANCETQGYLIRQDWLDELGLEIPTTYDELHDVLAAFKENYNCEGMYYGGVDDARLDYGYECANGGYMVIDGAIVSGYLQDSYYEYISMVRDWYSEGLIYSDYYSAATGDYDQLLVSNNTGIVQGAATSFSTIYAYLTEDELDSFSLAAMTPVKNNADDELHYSWNAPSYLKRTDAWAIGSCCEDPVPLVEFVNYMYSDEGSLLFNYGTEGETFTYDEDGKPQYTDLVINNPDNPYFFASYLYVSNAATEYFPSLMDVSASYYAFGDAEWNAYDLFSTLSNDGAYNVPNGIAMTAEESERYSELESDFDTYVEETINSWVIGQSTLDEAAFEAFKAQLQELGLEEMISLKQAAYDRYQDKLSSLGF